LFQSERGEYLFRRNFAEVEMVIEELHKELSKSEFQPRWFELSFSDHGGDLPAIHIVGEKMTAKLEGKVDRVDLWRQGEKLYVRVIDYKTGKKKFDYSDILYGLGMQMLLYLFTLEQSEAALFENPVLPAGVLYFPARMEQVNLPSKHDEITLEKKRRESSKRSGLILDEEPVLQAMEVCDHEPTYLPYGYDKTGERKGSLVTAERMSQLAELVFAKVAQLGDELYSGKIEPNPYFFDSKSNACAFCPYGTVCRTDRKERWVKRVKSADEFWQEVETNA
ncbi:MAG: PD-(D/E)XK nuclease family protein, partial [Oscillospiraceae bacterium]|nr:PD-(D/E)XK nuclease family protein [Oscillospiraceae bacterium]